MPESPTPQWTSKAEVETPQADSAHDQDTSRGAPLGELPLRIGHIRHKRFQQVEISG